MNISIMFYYFTFQLIMASFMPGVSTWYQQMGINYQPRQSTDQCSYNQYPMSYQGYPNTYNYYNYYSQTPSYDHTPSCSHTPSYYPPPRVVAPQTPPVVKETPWDDYICDSEFPVLPDFTPRRWAGLSLLVPDSAETVRTKSTQDGQMSRLTNIRRTLFEKVDKVNEAHKLMDELLPGVCGVEDSVLHEVTRTTAATNQQPTATELIVPSSTEVIVPSSTEVIVPSTNGTVWLTVPAPDKTRGHKRSASPDGQLRNKRQRHSQRGMSLSPLLTSTPKTDTKPCVGEELPSPISSSGEVKRELARGVGAGVYPCDQCDKVYRHRSSLHSHYRTHTGQLYTCLICARTFSHQSTHIKHQRVHSKQRPYTCHVCKSSFTQAGNLRRHIRRMHAD